MKLMISIDTEADDQWSASEGCTVKNLKFIPRFQSLCESYHFIPSYLCTYEIVESDDFDAIILTNYEAGAAEIGTHLHPWSNPPYESPDERKTKGFPTELSNESFKKKLTSLTRLIQKKTEKQPVVYRAGRWGFNANQITPLLELGYLVDCSVTPFVDWSKTLGITRYGENFSHAPCDAYHLNSEDVCKKGNSKLVEIPPTILFTNYIMNKSSFLRDLYFKHNKSFFIEEINKIISISPEWLRPFPHVSAKKLIDIARRAMKDNYQYLELMLHSSELMPKGSPYSPTKESVDALYDKVEALFRFLQQQNVHGSTFADFAKDV
jgi:hypothetical protein